jgi:hypothetical protein
VNQTNSAISIASIVPLIAKSISGTMTCSSTASAGVSISLASTAASVGGQTLSVSPPSGVVAPLVGGVYSRLNIIETGVIYLSTATSSGALSSTANISEYTI